MADKPPSEAENTLDNAARAVTVPEPTDADAAAATPDFSKVVEDAAAADWNALAKHTSLVEEYDSGSGDEDQGEVLVAGDDGDDANVGGGGSRAARLWRRLTCGVGPASGSASGSVHVFQQTDGDAEVRAFCGSPEAARVRQVFCRLNALVTGAALEAIASLCPWVEVLDFTVRPLPRPQTHRPLRRLVCTACPSLLTHKRLCSFFCPCNVWIAQLQDLAVGVGEGGAEGRAAGAAANGPLGPVFEVGAAQAAECAGLGGQGGQGKPQLGAQHLKRGYAFPSSDYGRKRPIIRERKKGGGVNPASF